MKHELLSNNSATPPLVTILPGCVVCPAVFLANGYFLRKFLSGMKMFDFAALSTFLLSPQCER